MRDRHTRPLRALAVAVAVGVATAIAPAAPTGAVPPPSPLAIQHLGIYEGGGRAASEIAAFSPATARVFVTNGAAERLDVLDVSDPTSPSLAASIDLTHFGASPTSVAVRDPLVAVAVEATTPTDPGTVVFFRTDTLTLVDQVTVGALPDMVTFAPNGRFVLVANEGEPNEDYTVDPEGSVSIIPMRGIRPAGVATADFRAWNGREDELRAAGVRIFGPNASAAQDLEPEYITVSHDSRTAWVALQEANAIATVDIASATVTRIDPLGYKNHALAGNGIDASDRDNAINIATWPVFGMYMPDAIASYRVGGRTYLVTANEGDARERIVEDENGNDVAIFVEEARVRSLTLDPVAFPNRSTLRDNANLGRLTVTTTLGDANGDGLYEALYAFGARSISIVDAATGAIVWDSGDQLEQVTARRRPDIFNANHTFDATETQAATADTRSDNKGPEPEGVVLGVIDGRTYAFVGLERIGGFVVYDVTDPRAPVFVDWIQGDVDGSLGPEGIVFVPAEASPTGHALVIVTAEVSGTTSIFEVRPA